jgi:hypothetical protein
MKYIRGIPIKTIDPNSPTGPKIEVFLPHDIYLRAYKYDSVKYENLRAVDEVLKNPKRIFWGIREHSEGGWCYIGKPTKLYIRENEAIDFPQNMVFAVYVTDRYEVFDWIVEYADDKDNLNPKGWEDRYRSLKWMSIS